MTALLEVKDLRVAYGKIEAVKGISFTVNQGEVTTLIGTNGAGKTTTLRTLSGLLKPTGGTVTFDGQALTTVPAHKIVALGLAHSPEGRDIFPRMTIEENLLLGAFLRTDTAGIAADVERAYGLFPILGERRKQAAGDPVRRRAADARHGPGTDVPAEAADAGRALDGALPADDAEDHGDHRGAEG